MIQSVGLTILLGAALLTCWLWRPRQKMEPVVWVLLITYALLGAPALWFGLYPGQVPAEFLFWKPTVMYWTLSIILIVAPRLGWGYPDKVVVGTYFAFSNREWRLINLAFAAFCAVLGSLNLLIAFRVWDWDWDGFKFGCMVNVVAIFLLRLSFIWLDTAARSFVYLYGRAKAFFQ